VPVLAIIGLYVGVYMVIAPSFTASGAPAASTYGLDQNPCATVSDCTPSSGVFSAIADVFTTIGHVLTLLFNALIFNVPGAPIWVQVPVAVCIISSLSWSIVTLIRGN